MSSDQKYLMNLEDGVLFERCLIILLCQVHVYHFQSFAENVMSDYVGDSRLQNFLQVHDPASLDSFVMALLHQNFSKRKYFFYSSTNMRFEPKMSHKFVIVWWYKNTVRLKAVIVLRHLILCEVL
jgi:hypothetical protein